MLKKVISDKRVYITAIILTIIGFIPFFVAMGLGLSTNIDTPTFSTYPYVICGIIAVYVLVGFAWADGYQASIRHKTKNYDGILKDENILSAWKRRAPFFMAAIVLLILVVGLGIGYWVNGVYVFA